MKTGKKILTILILICAVIAGLSFYLEKMFLPEKIKKLATDFLEEQLELEASLQSVDFSFWKGIEVKGFAIKNPAGFKEEKLIKIERAVLKPSFLSLLRRKPAVSAIFIDEPQFSLERNQKGIWNIERLLKPSPQKSPPKEKSPDKKFSLRVSKIVIRQGNISFRDEGITPSFSRKIKNINLNVSPVGGYLALIYNFNLAVEEDETVIKGKGKFFPLAKRGGIELDINHLPLSGFSPYLNKAGTFSFDNGLLDLALELSVDKNGLDGRAQLNLSQIVLFLKDIYDTPLVFSSGKIDSRFGVDNEKEEINFKNSSISIGKININGQGEIKSFKTNPEFNFYFSSPLLDLKEIAFAFPTSSVDFYKSLEAAGPFTIRRGELSMPFKNSLKTAYKINLEIQKAGCKFPFLNSRIENIQGHLDFGPEKIEAKKLTAQIEKLPFSLGGNWGTKRNAPVNLDFSFSEFSLANLEDVFKKNFAKDFPPLDFQGKGEGKLNIAGQPSKLNWQGDIKLIEAAISQKNRNNPIEKLNGQIHFSDDSFSTKSLRGIWRNKPLSLSGYLEDFKEPKLELNLSGEGINLKGKTQHLKEGGELLELSGNYQGIPMEARGKLKKIAPLTFDGSLKSSPLELNKLVKILPANFKEIYKKIDLSGTASLSANLAGELLNWKTWKANGRFSFPKLHVTKCSLKEFSSNFNLNEQKLSLSDLKAAICQGALRGNFQINLAESYPSYTGTFSLSNVDLSRLSQETDWKDLDLQGLGNSEVKFNGFGGDWNKLKGGGWIHLAGSRLWEIPLLGELSNILLIPGLDKTIIREGHCNLNINQGRVYTRDLELLSDNLTLKAEGSAGFDTTLDFDILMQFSGALRKEAKSLTKLANLVLKTVEQLLVQIELKGTIGKPKYTVRPFPVDKILEREIKNKLGDFLKDLLEEKP